VAKRVFVSSLPFDVTEDEVGNLCQTFTDITSCKLCIDYATNLSRGFAFVDCATDAGAQTLINQMHGYRWGSRSLRAELARPRPTGDEHRSLYS
jgi:RNA recognition motif-containing protein